MTMYNKYEDDLQFFKQETHEIIHLFYTLFITLFFLQSYS